MIQNLHPEEIDVLLGIFLLERRSELTIKADKDCVSQQVRTTDQKAKPMRKVSGGEAAKILGLSERLLLVRRLGPGRDPTSQRQIIR
jgi:hypothetical protein